MTDEDGPTKLRLMGTQAGCEKFLEVVAGFADVTDVRGPVPNRRGSLVRFYANATIRPDARGAAQ